MKFTTPVLTLLASSVAAQGTVQSTPFNLVLSSHNHTLNGAYLAACHEGAAIESLCVIPGTAPTSSPSAYSFQLNTTDTATNTTNGELGTLTWSLPLGTTSVSQVMRLVNQGPGSNLAFAAIVLQVYDEAYGSTEVAFDAQSKMNLQDGLQEGNPSAGPNSGVTEALYRWYVCENVWLEQKYAHLMWVYGEGRPFGGKDCEKVEVKRVFV